ncbi:hypothetical protein B0H13DRAFT_1896657 [Mycena leptocephala]|nr:hypothetical protein B0H13DRAFT_1896657 [Mycena leptocephala]
MSNGIRSVKGQDEIHSTRRCKDSLRSARREAVNCPDESSLSAIGIAGGTRTARTQLQWCARARSTGRNHQQKRGTREGFLGIRVVRKHRPSAFLTRLAAPAPSSPTTRALSSLRPRAPGRSPSVHPPAPGPRLACTSSTTHHSEDSGRLSPSSSVKVHRKKDRKRENRGRTLCAPREKMYLQDTRGMWITEG